MIGFPNCGFSSSSEVKETTHSDWCRSLQRETKERNHLFGGEWYNLYGPGPGSVETSKLGRIPKDLHENRQTVAWRLYLKT